MASVEGLAKVQGLIQGTNQQLDQQARADAAKTAADLFQAGDIKGALTTLARVDPDNASKLIAQFQQFDPASQGALTGAKQSAELESQAQYGSSPAQLQANQIASNEKIAQMRANQEPSDREKRLNSQFNQTMAFKYQDSAEKSALYKSGIESLNEIPTLKELLDDAYKNGGQSLAAIGPKLAKALGERGVLTDADVSRYVTNPALANSILSKGTKAFEGKLTSSDYANLMRLGTVMEQKAQKKVEQAYKNAAVKMSRATGIPLDEAELLVNPTIDEPSKAIILEPYQKKAQSEQPDPNKAAREWLAANPNHPKAAAVKAKLGIK